jgi:hypothetical protein
MGISMRIIYQSEWILAKKICYIYIQNLEYLCDHTIHTGIYNTASSQSGQD